MKILAFDISGFACSIAIGDLQEGQYEIISQFHKEMALGQAHVLMPEIKKILESEGMGVSDLDGMVVTRGPGSFTGIRAQIAAAKGLSLAHNLPVLGIDNFTVYVHKAQILGKPFLVVLESKRQDLYMQLFSETGTPQWQEGVSLEIEDLEKKLESGIFEEIVVVGDGQHHLASQKGFSIDKNVCSIGAQDMLSYTANAGLQGLSKNLDLLKPLYLRPALVQ